MPKGTVKDAQELPLVLTMRHIQEIMGVGKDAAYQLPHIQGFPAIRLGKSIRVPRDRFFDWLDTQANGQEK
jgi:hypothetical protein